MQNFKNNKKKASQQIDTSQLLFPKPSAKAAAGFGLCECGCGRPTTIATRNHAAIGLVKGLPTRFLVGHARRKPVTDTYRKFNLGNGTFLHLHRLRAERALGRPLPVGAVVHHADGSTRDDAPLVICENQRYHMLLHARERIVRAGGNPNTEAICGHCKKIKSQTDFAKRHRSVTGLYEICRQCTKKKAVPSYQRAEAKEFRAAVWKRENGRDRISGQLLYKQHRDWRQRGEVAHIRPRSLAPSRALDVSNAVLISAYHHFLSDGRGGYRLQILGDDANKPLTFRRVDKDGVVIWEVTR